MPHQTSIQLPIAIIGGGPSGLTFARLLETAHINYTIFERDTSPQPSARFQGGTLDLHSETGQAALRRAGLTDEFEKLARRNAMTMTIQDAYGNHRSVFDEVRDAPEIDRLQLRRMLLDSIPMERVRWGKTLASVENGTSESKVRGAAGIALHFADGTVERGFRLVVGADGAWSRLRQLVCVYFSLQDILLFCSWTWLTLLQFTPAKPLYSGKSFIEGRLSPNNPQYNAALEMVGAGNSMATGSKSTLCIQQTADSSYRVYMGLIASEAITRPGGIADVTDTEKTRAAMLAPDGFYGDWAPHLRAFIAAAEGPWRAWPLYRLDPDIFLPAPAAEDDKQGDQGCWRHVPGATMLGDAAHISTPNGEGVNQAMYDALVLFEIIMAEVNGGEVGDGSDEEADIVAIERAVVKYEAEMRPRARDYIQRCIEDEALFWGEDAASRLVEMFHEAMKHVDESKSV
jgi:2-polyprenyl-6-methoxyphenol hydroxylase-like FAD-dependent oxidoreductase